MARKKSAPEKLEAKPSKRKKTMKETTKSLLESESLLIFPTEILAKIFNFLSNQDIRCGVSSVCKKFYEICQNQSLVPVKDLCIYGQPAGPKSEKEGQKGKQDYILKGREAVHDVIKKSENLTYLKIKAVNNKSSLVYTALQSCPKLSTLEIIDTLNQLGEYF